MLKRILHFVFGCNQSVDVGHGRMGHVYRCSQCLEPWLVTLDGKKQRLAGESQAMDYAENFSG